MAERKYMVLTAVGPDRPGLVQEIASVIHEAKANLEDSRMAILRDGTRLPVSRAGYARLSQLLGVSSAVVKRLLHEFRLRYRRLLREEVAATVANETDVDQEIRYLCIVLSSFAA